MHWVLKSWRAVIWGTVVGIALSAQGPADGAAAEGTVGNFEAGVVAYLEGDFAGAAASWQPLAEADHAAAQYNLGNLYLTGRGREGDVAEAAWWFGKAARAGHVRAQYALAVIYQGTQPGSPVPADGDLALKWLTAAASQGHRRAQYDLGMAYAGRGTGVLADLVPDMVAAWQWLTLAQAGGIGAARAALEVVAADLPAAQRRRAETAAAAIATGFEAAPDGGYRDAF